MEVDIRRKRKIEQATELTERMKWIQEEAEAALKRAQEEIKKQADRGRRKVEIMEKERQSNAEYKRLRIQRTNSKKISGPLCGTIYH